MKHDMVPDVEFVQDVLPLKFEDVVFGYALGVLKQQLFYVNVGFWFEDDTNRGEKGSGQNFGT
jgi:hypothetical protein